MKRGLWFFCLFLSVPLWAQTLMQTLPNGMKVLVREDKRAPVVAVRLWYRVGSVDEQAGKTGLSHALEHMMFKGTPAVPSGEYSRLISSWGGYNNAYTNRTETVYLVDIAAAHLHDVLKLEADRMTNLNFNDRDFANEMDVIREERRMRYDDSPWGRLYETQNAHLWQRSNNRAAVIGYMDDLHRLTADDLRAWYRQWYVPNNALLVVVGDVDAQKTLADAATVFGSIPAKTLPKRRLEAETPRLKRAQSARAYSVTAQPLINLSWRVPRMSTLDDHQAYALEMLALVLNGTDSSRYRKNLVRGKASALYVGGGYSDYGRKNAVFSLSAMPAAGVSAEALKKQMLAEIRDIAQHGISADEMALIRVPLETDKILSRDSVRNQADTLGELETNGFGYQSEDEQLQRLLAVDAEAVRQAAEKLLAAPYQFTQVLPETGRNASRKTARNAR